MSLASLLLRILLSALLVFNGAAGAAAGVRMAGADRVAPAAASSGPQMAMAGCHDKSAVPAQQAQQAHDPAAHAADGHSGADTCCKDRDACRCDCLHQGSALMPDPQWRAVASPPPAAATASVATVATAPQRLPLRPPIA